MRHISKSLFNAMSISHASLQGLSDDELNHHIAKISRIGLEDWYKTVEVADAIMSYDRAEVRSLALNSQIQACSVNGFISVMVDSTDCDMCRGADLSQVHANRADFDSFCDSVYMNAEGRTSISILTPEEAAEFESFHRDYAAEAFEDGHAHVVYM